MQLDEAPPRPAPPVGAPPKYVSHTHKRLQDEEGGNHVVFWVSDEQVILLLWPISICSNVERSSLQAPRLELSLCMFYENMHQSFESGPVLDALD